MDAGTGHEVNFLALLYCLCRLGLVAPHDAPSLALAVCGRYLELARSLQAQLLVLFFVIFLKLMCLKLKFLVFDLVFFLSFLSSLLFFPVFCFPISLLTHKFIHSISLLF